MKTSQRMQHGASALGIIIFLAIFGAGAYIGLQYLPQYFECGTVDSILSNIEKANEKTPVTSVKNIRNMIDKQLNMNQMDDMQDDFTVTQDGEKYIVKVSYERELNLIYEKKPMKYEKTLTLE
jgi:hypothetical protein